MRTSDGRNGAAARAPMEGQHPDGDRRGDSTTKILPGSAEEVHAEKSSALGLAVTVPLGRLLRAIERGSLPCTPELAAAVATYEATTGRLAPLRFYVHEVDGEVVVTISVGGVP